MGLLNSKRKPTFFWQGLLILLPVIVFIVIGVGFLRRDKMLVEQEARQNAQVLAQQISDFISSRIAIRLQDQYLSALQAKDQNPSVDLRITMDIGPEEYQVPMPQYRRLLAAFPPHRLGELSTAGYEYWPRLIVATNGEILFPPAYPTVPVPCPEDQGAFSRSSALKLLHSAQTDIAKGRAQAAQPALLNLAANTNALQSELGIPLQPLASLERLRLLNTNLEEKEIHAAAAELASNAVVWPSMVTPLFLEEAVRFWPASSPEDRSSDAAVWQQRWHADEDSRELYTTMRDEGTIKAFTFNPLPAWHPWRGQNWLIIPRAVFRDWNLNEKPVGIGFCALPETLVEMALLELTDQSKRRIPAYASVSYQVSGKSFPTNAPGPLLAETESTWKLSDATKHGLTVRSKAFPGLFVRVHLSKPEALFAVQLQRLGLFGGLIFASALAALIGFLTARHAFHRQLRLSEMKSNFVSSVSHELRAPIASVRLMAEGLERGKIQDPQKQREYFHFITQECRRLSALVENVLDFSRIEQGCKQYEFETTDLVALADHTVRLMEAAAAELQIRLVFQKRGAPVSLELDGKAIQQALINLLDNALKHSPKNSVITVGIDFGAEPAADAPTRTTERGFVQLWVEDQGEGIPRAEHEKIFERFYRRGSELRRETQGVGIGLSIVKHIIEAHGGRVVVRSAEGQGSRFTIWLPK